MALMMNAFEISAYVLSLVCHEQEKLQLLARPTARAASKGTI
jgi:hypothetical protein